MYLIMACIIGLGLLVTIMSSEPDIYRASPFAHLAKIGSTSGRIWEVVRVSIAAPFLDFMQRPGWILLLLFVIMFKVPDAFAAAMTNPLLLELGFSKMELAALVKLYGFAATIVGAMVGGVLPFRYDIVKCLWIAILLQALSNFTLLWQYYAGHDLLVLVAQISIENFCGAMGGTIIVSYLSRLCVNPLYTATQYALLSSVAALGRTTLSTASGWTVDQYGWVVFVCISVLLAIPSMLILTLAKNYVLGSIEKRA